MYISVLKLIGHCGHLLLTWALVAHTGIIRHMVCVGNDPWNYNPRPSLSQP